MMGLTFLEALVGYAVDRPIVGRYGDHPVLDGVPDYRGDLVRLARQTY